MFCYRTVLDIVESYVSCHDNSMFEMLNEESHEKNKNKRYQDGKSIVEVTPYEMYCILKRKSLNVKFLNII